MKKGRAVKKKKILDYNRMGMMSIAVVVLLLLGISWNNSRSLGLRLSAYEQRAEELTAQIESEKTRTEEIDALKEYMKTDEYAEEVARNRLGLVKSNELVFEEQKEMQQ